MRVLVTGAAGYIGAHIVHELLSDDHTVFGIDNLSTGLREFIHPDIQIFQGDVSNPEFVDNVFNSISSDEEVAVIHAAGLKFAGESVLRPLEFYKANSVGTEVLISAMQQHRARALVFSSSCSIYGSVASGVKVSEKMPPNPASPYGRSKYFAEQILNDAVNADQINGISLRYFNVIGNAPIAAHDRSPFNLIPNIFRSFDTGKPFKVFGSDYSTKDGTCVRDYVDVITLAKVHVSALTKVLNGNVLKPAYNLGSSSGSTTMEVVTAAMSAVGKSLNVELHARRAGDPEIIQADIAAAKSDLNWDHVASLEEMISASWESWKKFSDN